MRFDLKGKGVAPQQAKLVDVLSQGRRYAAVLLPRQSSKTSSLDIYLLGLCATVPGLRVMFLTASIGKRGQAHFWEDIAPVLQARFPDPKTRPFILRTANGSSSIAWPNGSRFSVALTHQDFIGASVDIAWIDEAGTLSGDKATEVLSSILPTQDTRKGVVLDQPLCILSGTAGSSRTGNALWKYLELGREGDPSVSILEYSADQDLTVDDIETWEDTESLILETHPAIGNLTDLDTIHDNYKIFNRERFLTEYLGVFGMDGGTDGLVKPAKWYAGELNETPAPPEYFAVGVATTYKATSATVCAAWRVDGVAHVVILRKDSGVDWLPEELEKLGRAHDRVPIGYDDHGDARVAIKDAEDAYARLYTVPIPTKDITAYGPLFLRELNTGNLRHYGQSELTSAALLVRQRKIGENGWGFGRPHMDADTSAVEAAAYALITYDNNPERTYGISFG
ncbi:hypothetical protein DOE76_13905 [Leifsonia sp. ku-ls]|nr:hypothetical protein DOE76_13905 [Leifsonia sp. ku-ls]